MSSKKIGLKTKKRTRKSQPKPLSMLSWDSTALRAPSLPWTPLHHSAIKQEPMEPPMVNGFISSRSEGFHSASPSSSSRDSNPQSSRSNTPHSPHDQSATGFGPLTPPGIEAAPENMRTPAGQTLANTVTPPKSPSPSPPWVSHSEGAPSPGDSAPECDEEPGLRVPAVNSHGKVKTFKCKQCQFVAVTKVDFWEHSRVHIKPERMLTCLQCPFVTEYKHHLEYHMRNHVGVKPFECKLCAYTCVNKSMLNSHLKSHSNVYQYRCADCNYATKYCHSLKLHLRKYEHQPAMVLNQDGTPNPLPIIDVYGTRRGPKQRTQSKMQEETAVQTAMSVAQPHSLFSNPFGVSFPYAPLLQHPILFPHNNNLNEPNIFAKVMENSKKEEEIQMQTLQNIPPHLLLQQRFLTEYGREASDPAPLKSPPREKPSPRASPYSPRRTRAPSRGSTVETNVQPNADALDLTNARPELQIDPPTTPTTSLKHRRKGKAFKLERSRMEEDEPEMASFTSGQVEEIEVSVDPPKFDYESDNKTDNEKSISSPEPMDHQSQAEIAAKDDYDCHYCDIVFKDIVMYTMHMGYHGFKDPFTCNMCGHSSADKVSFFVHIARSQHS